MKVLLFACALFAGSLLYAQAPAKQVKASADDMPYKARLTTKFSIGSPQYSKIILNLWKDWDNGTLQNFAPLMADDITAVFPDGTVEKGKEKLLNAATEYRSQFETIKSEIITYTTLKLNDGSNSNVVLIWGEEQGKKKDGSEHKMSLHEVWMFDKNGKISYIQQYAGVPPKEL